LRTWVGPTAATCGSTFVGPALTSIGYKRSKLHHELRGKPGAANRCLALLSKMFNLAEAWGLRPEHSNPVRHIDRYPERKGDGSGRRAAHASLNSGWINEFRRRKRGIR
jgi:hypothetical protein